jgi:uncharacterized protein (DUF1697 family)
MNTIYISLLRGINIGGHKMIKMTDLKALYESLGLVQVVSYIQSGNVLFTALQKQNEDELSTLLGNAIQAKFGFEVPVVIRTLDEMQKTISHNPFENEAETDPNKLVVMFLGATPDAEAIEKIHAKINDNSRFRIVNNMVYFFYPDGYGQTKWTNTFFEKQLKTVVTARNWKTTIELVKIGEELKYICVM